MSLLCIILGIVCMLYFLAVLFTAGTGSKFFIFGILGGLVLITLGFEFRFHFISARVPKWLILILKTCMAIGAILFIFVEGCILGSFWEKGEPDLDYIIVLGAKVRESGPSLSLQKRLDKAYEYLAENGAAKVIVSGGQGSDEPMPEADCMAEYLMEKGIAQERIVREDRSTNTAENLSFSRQMLEGDVKIGVVTNRFHVFRSVRIARKTGFRDACGIAADTYGPSLPNDMLREFFGVLKDFAFGNM